MRILSLLLSLVLAAPALAQPAYQPGPGPVPFSTAASLNTVTAATAHNEVTGTDGAIAASSTAFNSASATFTTRDVGKTIIVNGSGVSGADLQTTIAAYVDAHNVTLAAPTTFATPWWSAGRVSNGATTGVTTSYAINDVLTIVGGTQSTAAAFTIVSLGVNAPTVNAGGSGGANGACTVQGTTGVTRTNWTASGAAAVGFFTASGTVSGGVLTGPLTIVQEGDYSTAPTAQTAEPVVPITGCAGLTGATVSLKMAPHALRQTVAGHYTALPANPAATTGGSGSGATLTISSDAVGGYWAYGTDDTSAVNAAIATVGATGGTVVLPTGNSLVLGALVIPYTGTDHPKQNPIRITGGGQNANSYLIGALPSGIANTALDMRYAGGDGTHVAKIDTRGAGVLAIDNITIRDGGTDNYRFVQTTNTTLNFQKVTFSGNPTCYGQSCQQNVISLGGLTPASATFNTNAPDAGFQGYGSTFTSNTFDHIQEAVSFGGAANASVFTANVGSYSNGSYSPTSGFYTFYGVGAGADANVFTGDIIECPGYIYCVVTKTNGSNNNGNGFLNIGIWDTVRGAPTLGAFYFDVGSGFNIILQSWVDPNIAVTFMTDVGNLNNLISGSNYTPSQYFAPTKFLQSLTVNGAMTASGAVTVNNGAAIGNNLIGNHSSENINIGGTSGFDINVQSASPYMLVDNGNHSSAAFQMQGTTPNVLLCAGTNISGACYHDLASPPISIFIEGTHATAGIYEHSTTPIGINLVGTYSNKQVQGTGWSVSPTGTLNAAGYQSGGTAGVSCAAGTFNAATAVFANGILTKCF